MFKIAVCDDDEIQCSEIENMVGKFFLTETFRYELDVYISGNELLQNLKNEEKYDLIYLDIELEQMNGVFVGKFIREELCNEYTQIVYISGKTSYALDLFQIRPLNFLVKPLQKKQFFETLKKAIELQGRQSKIFTYKTGKTEKRIAFKEIMYFSSDLKKIKIHMRTGTDTFYGKLIDIVSPEEDFICIHKSYIVNCQYIQQFKYDSLILANGEELPISRAYRKDTRNKLMEWHKEGKR